VGKQDDGRQAGTATTEEEAAPREQRGIQSVEVSGQLLHALAHHGRPMGLKELATAARMAPAKAHPYLVSLGKIGIVEQDRATGRYGLGVLTLQLGLMALQQSNPVRIATPLVIELAQAIGHTVGIAVWGTRGPTIVLLEEAPSAVHVNMRHGTVFSIADTASGRLFGAYRPTDEVRELYERERKQSRAEPGAAVLPPWNEFQKQVDDVRLHALGRSEGGVVAGVSALSAPVFDHTGLMVLALTAIGPSAALDSRWDGQVAGALKACAQAVSARLGHRAERNGGV